MSARQLALALALSALTACAHAPAWQRTPHDARFSRAPQPKLHSKPTFVAVSESWTALDYVAAGPISRGLSPGSWVDAALGPRPALDVNHFGEVLDSPWFENRLARRDMSPEEIARGPNRAEGPADGPLLVLGGKAEGATPGLMIEDTRGDRYLIKFDPPAFPELASGAELVATKVLHAAGYHVPENYVMRFELDRLVLSPTAQTGGAFGETIPLTERMVRDLIALVNPYPDGTVRALFSKIIDGAAIGPFSYRGTRADDPNDRLPHERRRSLRGLRLFSAWLNNVDTRDANSLDVFIEADEAGVGYVKHYLLDFGDALGSDGTKPKYPGQGYEGLVDWPLIGQSFFTAGLWYRYWLPVQRAPLRAVGIFEGQVFDPERWQPALPNPAFDDADALDEYWAASIIARFDVEDLIAIVRSARYSNPAAQAWILRVLLQRQYAILADAFDRVLPLDDPRVEGFTVRFEDLAVRAALLTSGQAGYRWRLEWHHAGERFPIAEGENHVPHADLSAAFERLADEDSGALERYPFFTVTMTRPLPAEGLPGVQLHLRYLPEGLIAVGLEREAR